MERFEFKNVYTSVAGDYYQILFEDNEGDGQPYFMIQCDFEFPSRKCYIESNREHMIGHYFVNEVKIENGIFTVLYGKNNCYVAEVKYSTIDSEQKELIEVSKVMFDKVIINE